MSILDSILSGGRPAKESDVNIDEFLTGAKVSKEEVNTWVEVVKLTTKEDVNNIIEEVRKNNIILVDITPMLKDRAGVKNVVDKLKTVCIEVDGDIGRISATQIIVVPGGMRVRKT